VKIAVIGGAGVRTPLLVNGLTRSDLPIDEIGLFDIDQERLGVISSLAGAFTTVVRPYRDAGACVAGADFVILSIRAGGIAARARDEAIAIAHDTVGQETIGAGGFAMALRTIPHAVEYARLVEREAPRAWVISFTNPVGIITQAMTTATRARVIGICDTPTELFEDVAHVLGVESSRCDFDYFGLNHLGWLREVRCDGEPQLHRVWDDPELLKRVYRAPLFDLTSLRQLRLLPTEYLFYYYEPHVALENTKKAGQTRGGAIAQLNAELFGSLAVEGADRRRVYEQYLQARNAGYMQIESGAAQPIERSPWAGLTGYDKIALSVVRAIHFNSNAIIPLNVPNRGAIRDLDELDVVEVPCVVNANGARPLAVGAVPGRVRGLLVRVKEYERLTVEAASTRSVEVAERALAANPLVGERALARRLIDALSPLWGEERV
jgi:6-phospho-beta-glucosidase